MHLKVGMEIVQKQFEQLMHSDDRKTSCTLPLADETQSQGYI